MQAAIRNTAAALVLFALNAHADSLYIAPLGNDDSPTPNNPATPLATIRTGISTAASGDSIIIAPGTYTESNLVLDKNLTLTGNAEVDTIIQAADAPGNANARVFSVEPGIRIEVKFITIRNGFFEEIGSDHIGAGIHNAGDLTLVNSTVTDNTAGPGANGGGIFNSDTGNLAIIDSTISNNAAGDGVDNPDGVGGVPGSGGGIFNAGTVTILRSLVSGNNAGAGGAGMFGAPGGNGGGLANIGTATSHCSTFSGNCTGPAGVGEMGTSNGGNGGAVDSTGFPFTATFSTFTLNKAHFFGGGVHFNHPGDFFIIGNTIAFDNIIVGGADNGPDIAGTITSRGYNIVGDPSFFSFGGQTDMVGKDPLIGALSDNGGPTLTHALLPGSPAIDAADQDPTDPPPIDQRGFARSDGLLDIGAFEFGAEPPVARATPAITDITIDGKIISFTLEPTYVDEIYTLKIWDDFDFEQPATPVAGGIDISGTGDPMIFTDGFEPGDTSAWSISIE